jgi:hypothetical protein
LSRWLSDEYSRSWPGRSGDCAKVAYVLVRSPVAWGVEIVPGRGQMFFSNILAVDVIADTKDGHQIR